MTNQIPSPGSNPSSQLPAVPNTEAAIAPAMPMGPAPWMEQEQTGDGFDLASFMHSLRRRWLVGLGLGLLIASLFAAMLSLILQVQHEAMVLIRIRRAENENYLNRKGSRSTTQDFELFKKTQSDLLKSTFVVNAALRKPGISQLKIVQEKPFGGTRKDPVAWLERQVKVNAPEGSEIVIMSMKERNADEVKRILDAITDSYLQEIIFNDNVRQTEKLERLRVRERRTREDMKKKLEEIKMIAETFGSVELEQNKLKIDLSFQRLRNLEQDKMMLDRSIREIQDNLFMLNAEYQNSRGYKPKPWEIEDALAQTDPEYGMIKTQIIEMKQQSSGAQLGVGGGAAMQSQMAQLQSQLNQIREAKKKELVERLSISKGNDPNEIQKTMRMLEGTFQIHVQRLKKVDEDIQKQTGEISQMGKSNADLQIRQIELTSAQKVLNELTQEIEAVALKMEENEQIQVLQKAHVPAESSWFMKYVQIGGAWFIALMGTLAAVAYWDFQSKRVNTTKDVMDSGQLRVIGTLPMLNGRRAGGLLPMSANMRKAIEVGLGRSVDSIRTSLMYSKTKKPIEVLLVTSALGQEGKTTIASQLAVSFARSGRRTLLIDGDIRNPQQHVVLGMPFHAGLCELLRGDMGLEDVVRATPAEGLWHLSAGYRDPQTDQYLASPTVSKIFEDLRSRFDMIVIDTGPALTSPDAMLLGQYADSAIVSVRRDVSRLPKVEEAVTRLRMVGIDVAGAVVNGMAVEIRRSELQTPSPQSTNEPQLENVG